MRDGALYEKRLGDGREMTVYRYIYNDRIVIGQPESPFWDVGWCILQGHGVEVAEQWDGVGDPPGPWIKELATGRVGPGLARL